MNDEPILTASQFAEIIKQSKPYLVELEEQVEALQYGTLEVKITIRAGVVEDMTFVQRDKKWLRPKVKDDSLALPKQK